MTPSDLELLQRFARDHAQDAFTELVRRHLNLVYSAALRQVRSPQLAEEIAQSVFADLARVAATPSSPFGKVGRDASSPVNLTAWLFTVTRHTAVDVIRKESRRQLREQLAYEMNMTNAPDASWPQIEPLLDEAVAALDETDRAAVLLRYFENQSLRDVGQQLGVSDDAAQKRVSRAVERLREFFAKRGVTVGAGGLVVVISANAVQAAPVGLAVTISAAALAGTAATTSTLIAAITKTIAMTAFQKITIAAAIAAVVGVAVYELKRETDARKTKVEARPAAPAAAVAAPLKLALQLPAPKMVPAPYENQPAAKTVTPDIRGTNLLAKIAAGELLHLTTAQAEAYLQAKGRTAATLLAAYTVSADEKFLREAMQQFPSNPRVAFTAIVNGQLNGDELRQWADAFEKADPNNALPNYLFALAWFNAGQSDQAANELLASAGKSGFQDYSLQVLPDVEQAYLAAGYSDAEAKMAAIVGLSLPVAAKLRQVGKDITNLANGYQQVGDVSSAQSALLLAANLGQYYADSSTLLIQKLVGLAIENQALQSLPPDTVFGANGQIVQDELNQIARQRNELNELSSQTMSALRSMPSWPNQELLDFFTLVQQKGELTALQWLTNRKANY